MYNKKMKSLIYMNTERSFRMKFNEKKNNKQIHQRKIIILLHS